MENIKNIVEAGINIQRDKENEKYNLLINKLSKESNIANIYYIIGETYRNTLEQKEVAISYLKEALVNKFFKNAKVKADFNVVEFYNDEYKVIFPTSRVRSIEIIDLKINKVKAYNSLTSSWEHKLVELIEQYYFKSKSLSNLNAIRKHYIGMGDTKNPIRVILEYKETIKECNLNKMLEIRNKEILDVKRLISYETEVMIYNNRQKDSLNFVHSLTDLKSFTDAGWSVILKDTDRYGTATKIKYK